MGKIRAVLFDLDGTLLNRERSLCAFVSWHSDELFEKDDPNKKRFQSRFIELDDHGSVWKDQVYKQLISELELNELSSEELLENYIAGFPRFVIPVSGMLEEVRFLHGAGYLLGLVSNGPSPFQENSFAALGVADLFASVVVSGAIGCAKPSADIFQKACTDLGVSPQECVFVGDNPKADIEGANALGMYSVYIPSHWGSHCAVADANLGGDTKLRKIVYDAR